MFSPDGKPSLFFLVAMLAAENSLIDVFDVILVLHRTEFCTDSFWSINLPCGPFSEMLI